MCYIGLLEVQKRIEFEFASRKSTNDLIQHEASPDEDLGIEEEDVAQQLFLRSTPKAFLPVPRRRVYIHESESDSD